MKLRKKIRLRKTPCETCVFGPVAARLPVERQGEIRSQCLRGVNQLCHHDDNRTICRGGREFQLTCWHRMGLIKEPTNAALRAAMLNLGLKPGDHV